MHNGSAVNAEQFSNARVDTYSRRLQANGVVITDWHLSGFVVAGRFMAFLRLARTALEGKEMTSAAREHLIVTASRSCSLYIVYTYTHPIVISC